MPKMLFFSHIIIRCLGIKNTQLRLSVICKCTNPYLPFHLTKQGTTVQGPSLITQEMLLKVWLGEAILSLLFLARNTFILKLF